MVALIKMPFALWSQVGPRIHVLDGIQIPMGRDNFERGRDAPIVKYRDYRLCVAAMQPLLSKFYFDHLLQS